MAPTYPQRGPTNLTPLAGNPPSTFPSSATGAAGAAPLTAPPSTILGRTQKWIEENQRLLILGACVAVVGGAGYLLYTRPSSATVDARGGSKKGKSTGTGKSAGVSSDEGEEEPVGASGAAAAGGSKKNKKKKNKKAGGSGSGLKEGFLKNDGDNGPLLEEIKPAQAQQGASSAATRGDKTDAASVSTSEKKATVGTEDHLEGVPDSAGIEALSESERNALGATLKDRGNQLYKNKEFRKAVECYTKAIEVSIKKDAVFYSNRAACYTNFSPAEYEKCVADCDSALALDHKYVKALKRRATALESLGRDEEAVRDFTAVTIIERFQDDQAAAAVERCLKKLASKKAKEILESREPKLPSPTFISSYLAAFRPHDKPTLPENPSQGDQTLSLSFDALGAADYNHAVSFVNEAIDQGISTKTGEAEAYNLRGTFKFLIGDSHGAKDDLEKALDLVPDFVQAWVKIASVHMELGDAASAFGDFEAAIRHNPNDPDIYYHRGQVYFIMQEFDKAIQDYNKSTELDGSFIFTHVQAAVAQYKLGQVGPSMAAFRRILKNFPDRGEPSNYYGELLLDQQKFEDSVERFDKSLELDKNRHPRNVLPLVNKSLAIFQWKQNIPQAEALCKEALDIDPDCDVAVATLAQLALQQGRIDEAITWFERSGKLARTEAELINSITYEHASRSQQAFLRNYPEFAERLSQMASAMQ